MLRPRDLLNRATFNRPIILTLLMLVAVFSFVYVYSDGFQHKYEHFGNRYGDAYETKFLEAHSLQAFNSGVLRWLEKSGYEETDLTWREVTGKPAYSQALGVRDDLRIFVRRGTRRSFQAWGLGHPNSEHKLFQVYRAMHVREWSKKSADEWKDAFEKDKDSMVNLLRIGRIYE